MPATSIAQSAAHDLTKLPISKLEALFAVHSKDEMNISISHRRHNWDVMLAIVSEIKNRPTANDKEAIRHLKAMVALASRAVTSSKKFGVPGPKEGFAVIRNQIDEFIDQHPIGE